MYSSLLSLSIRSPTRVLIPSCLSVTLSPKIWLYLTTKFSTLIWVDFSFRIFYLINSYSSLLDVDECFQGTHDCNLGKEYCLNEVGSFKCECKDGYDNPNGQCEGEWINFSFRHTYINILGMESKFWWTLMCLWALYVITTYNAYIYIQQKPTSLYLITSFP